MHNNEGGNCLTFVLSFTLSTHLLAYKKSLSSPLLQTHQKIMQKIRLFSYLLLCLHLVPPCLSWNHNIQPNFRQANGYEGSSDSVNLQYHMGPVLASPVVNIYIIWYGHWSPRQQETIRDFVYSLSASATFPSLADWWKTVRLYTDQTGSNITAKFDLSEEFYDSGYSQGHFLERLVMQSIIKEATSSKYPKPLPLNPNNGLYLILTSSDVQVQDFCREVCGFHYFTFPTIVGVTVPYAWVGYSGTQCPGMCAYPFATLSYPGNPPPEAVVGGAMRPPNGDAGVDGMLSVLAHELAEVSSNPLVNAWYAGDDPTAPAEIADLCVGVYGSGGGGGYVGRVYKDHWGDGYNVNGVGGRRFLVQWVWDPARRRCFGPNAMD